MHVPEGHVVVQLPQRSAETGEHLAEQQIWGPLTSSTWQLSGNGRMPSRHAPAVPHRHWAATHRSVLSGLQRAPQSPQLFMSDAMS